MNIINKKVDIYVEFILLFLFIFIPYREIISYLITPQIKLIPDILILSLFIYDLIKNNSLKKINAVDLTYGLFLFIALISTLYNGRGIKPFIVQARSITLYYLIYFIVRDKQFNDTFLTRFKNVITFNVIALFVFGCIEKIFNKSILFPSEWYASIIQTSNFGRVYSYFKNPNTYGAFLVLSLYVLIIIDRKFNKSSKWTYSLIITSLMMTASRSSLLALGIFIIIFVATFRSKDFIKLIAVSTVIGIALFSIIEVVDFATASFVEKNIESEQRSVVLERFGELGEERIVELSNIDGRLYSVKTGLEVFNDHRLLGSGFGTYGDAASLILGSPIYEKYGIRKNFYSDNEYIKVIAQTGILGTLAYTAFMLTILFYIIKNRNFYLLNLYIVLVFIGLFYNVFEIQIISLYFWFLYGLLMNESNHRKKIV
ncbi:O-antigen ligase [Alkalithermobacter thermoalcaliphilus JW-YL-7 = DSM 7308]|uniref:Lipid A core n=1 Tax=Alkalithermobacter thermoalcaliphilus JW-YL-7 = DSM 7308 TaxID=1121328 RepID=A0A150FSC7_CLOPD|nr:lipid A core [[Clostridium] paradoxum JW-YL-7 = DSM 7308]SHK72652.1 O-antigen ligase [[Clostridium] paradoxum JW-YL-7 = DSM 7308]